MRLGKEKKLVILFGILGVSMFALYGLLGGVTSNFKFSEISTTIVPPQPNSTSVNSAFQTQNNIQFTLTSSTGSSSQAVLSQPDYSTLTSEIPSSAVSNVKIVSIKPTESVTDAVKFYIAGDQNSVIQTPNNMTISNISTIITGSPKFLINPSVELFDSSNNPYQVQSYFNIPILNSILGNANLQKYTLIGPQGQILDLGNVVIALNGVTDQPNVYVTTSGTFEVLLDGVVRSQYTFYGQGLTSSQKIIPLMINNKPSYGFTFANEGSTWQNNSTHIFEVVLGNVTATVTSGTTSQTFQTKNSFLAYLLPMTLDNTKKVILNPSGNPVSVFLNDDTLQSCGQNMKSVPHLEGSYGSSEGTYTIWTYEGGAPAPQVDVSQNGFSLGTIQSIPPTHGNCNEDCTGPNHDPFCSAPITGIPRGTNLQITYNGQTYNVVTPQTQYGLKVTCTDQGCTNNFGG